MTTKISFFLIISTCIATQAALAAEVNDVYASDHILVKFKPDAVTSSSRSRRNVEKAVALSVLNLPDGCDVIESGFSAWQRNRNKKSAGIQDPVNLERFVRVTVPDGMTPESLSSLLNKRSDVEYAEPDGIGTGGVVPNDPNFTNQWFHRNTIYTNGPVSADIQSTSVWEITTGSSNVIIAVLDTGLVLTSPEFSNRVVAGYDFQNGDADPTDDHNHGSMVTGCMAAEANNSALVAGINWHCKIMPVKVLSAGNSGYYSTFANGIDFAVSNGAKVINFSIGGGTSDTTLSNSIMNAIAQGVIFVTITHNNGSSSVTFPGRMEKCITVAATTNTDIWAKFSNYGPPVDLCAPGDKIDSVNKTGALSTGWYGTSFSCPLVAGVAGMIAGIRPDITQEEMEAILCASADDQVGDAKDTPGWDKYHGWGRLNAYNAVVMAMSEIDFNDDGSGNLMMSWSSPPNASNRTPFQIQSAAAVTGIWSTVATASNLTYSATQTVWQLNGITGSNVMLRVRTRPR